MAVTLYSASVPVFTRMFNNLTSILNTAEANAAERKIKLDVLVNARLAPDMYPLSFQIQSATDRSKFFVARVTGKTAPSWADDEKTFDELRARLRKAIDYLATYDRSEIEGLDDKLIPLKVRGEEVEVRASDYLFETVYPNFFFHVTTAYDILRHNGVPLGKRDFVG